MRAGEPRHRALLRVVRFVARAALRDVRRFVAQLRVDASDAALVWATVARWNDAYNARDRETAASVAGDDMGYEDHRAARFGTLDRDGLLALADAIVDVTPDARIRFTEIAALQPYGVVARSWVESDGAVAGGFDSMSWWVLTVRGDQIRRLETFDVEERAAAIARLDAMAG